GPPAGTGRAGAGPAPAARGPGRDPGRTGAVRPVRREVRCRAGPGRADRGPGRRRRTMSRGRVREGRPPGLLLGEVQGLALLPADPGPPGPGPDPVSRPARGPVPVRLGTGVRGRRLRQGRVR